MEEHCDRDCPFDSLTIRRTEYAGDNDFAAVYNIAPVLPGHSLIIPRRHVERLERLSEDEVCHLFSFARRVTGFLLSNLNADGFDWTIQDGLSGGQSIDHVHLHVIPRWTGDLPNPGDWYTRLKLPITTDANGVIDSEMRRKLDDREMEEVVSALRGAAVKHGLGPFPDQARFASSS